MIIVIVKIGIGYLFIKFKTNTHAQAHTHAQALTHAFKMFSYLGCIVGAINN